eukprot:Seg2202.4 transcript_id=Seg2202.4/GoldUCD/mRNA.D3Y31 product=Arpin protein_id=Seg2202.4/GoldUCD/D3Y31
MSRAHMVYDNKALESIPVKVTNWSSWNQEDIFALKARNTGIIGDGILLGKSRHLIIDKVNQKNHYMIFHIGVAKASWRKFNGSGEEILPDFGLKQKVNTGYLMSSYKAVAKEGKDVLTTSELQSHVRVEDLEKLTKEKEQSFSSRNVVSLWFNERDFDGLEFYNNSEIRFRTKGEHCYIESITLLNPETKNLSSYTSEKPLGGTWTDKVMSMKDDGKDREVKQQVTSQGDAAEDDEWDD